ncbi:MAG: hypothetical protein R3C68_11850 [Myxococcota bacterium]
MLKSYRVSVRYCALLFAGFCGVLQPLGCKPSQPPLPLVRHPDGTPVKAPSPTTQAEENAAKSVATEAKTRQEQGDQSGAELLRDKLVQEYPGTRCSTAPARTLRCRLRPLLLSLG